MERLIITERTNLFEPNDAIGIGFFIRGTVSESQILSAFETVIYKNETLHSKIVLSESGDAWYEKVALSRNTMCPMEESWEKTLSKQQKILFQIDQGELLRGFYQLYDGGAEVLFLAHHLAGDGKSMISFVEQFMEVLGNQNIARMGDNFGRQSEADDMAKNSLPYRELRTIRMECMPGKIWNPIKMGLYLKFQNWMWQRSEKVFTMEDRARVHEQYWKERETVLFREVFSETELQRLKQKAKEAGVSISSYLLTAFAKEAGQKINIGIAIDGRKKPNKNMGNQTCGTELSFDYHKQDGKNTENSENFNKEAKRLHRRFHRKLASASGTHFLLYFMGTLKGSLVDSFFMQLFGGWNHKRSKIMAKVCGYSECKRYYSFSNLMQLENNGTYGEYELERFVFVPPLISYGRRLIGVVTLRSEMCVTYQIMQNDQTELERERFKTIMRELKK